MFVKIDTGRPILSPSGPAIALLYGILFGFALTSYCGVRWERSFTIIFYVSILLWSGAVLISHWRLFSHNFRVLDFLFAGFVFVILGSIGTHWWKGTIEYLEFMPFFVILPYLLGRMCVDRDVLLFRNLLIRIGCVLLLLIPIEYVRNVSMGVQYTDAPAPVLFGQSHGVMLSGLLLSAMLLALVSLLVSPNRTKNSADGIFGKTRIYGYAAMDLVVVVMVWISSRGSFVSVMLSTLVLLILFSSGCGFRKKAIIACNIVICSAITFGFVFQNHQHKKFYKQLLQDPVVASRLEDVVTGDRPDKLKTGHPVLGVNSCKDIKNSVIDRWVHYQEALTIFLSKPLTGVGANGYGFYTCTGPGWYPHSTILQVLAELGVVGGALYLAIIVIAFVQFVWRYVSLREGAGGVSIGWVVSYFILQLTTNQLYGNYFMSAGLYFVFGLAASGTTIPFRPMQTRE